MEEAKQVYISYLEKNGYSRVSARLHIDDCLNKNDKQTIMVLDVINIALNLPTSAEREVDNEARRIIREAADFLRNKEQNKL